MQNVHPAKGLSVGVIMDGNGRWAQKRGLPRSMGHKKGADVFDDIAHYADEIGVAAITCYAFSTENWSRSKEELDTIMSLFGRFLKRLYRHKKRKNRVCFLGDRAPLLPEYQKMMYELEEMTADRTGMILNVAVNYGGRQELVRAARLIAQDVQNDICSIDEIDENLLSQKLYTAGQKDPDLIIRTSGEQRLSNFLTWQSAYSEFVFTDVLWPDFSRAEFDAAIEEYLRRERRFGGVVPTT